MLRVVLVVADGSFASLLSCVEGLEGQAASKNRVAVTCGSHLARVREEEGHLSAGPRNNVDPASFFFCRLKRCEDHGVGVACVFSLHFVVRL